MAAGRAYEQRARADAADRTRRAILAAAYERLRSTPAEPLAVGAVADAAGVARSTVYLVFGSRAGLFDALAADLLERGRVQRLYDAVTHPDPREHLRDALRASCEMFAVDRDVRRALVSMSALDPDAVGGAITREDENRRGGTAHLADRLQAAGLLRPDVSRDDAAHLLWVLSSFDAFDSLYVGYRLDVEGTWRALAGTAERALLVPAGTGS
jgi:AcrR family transcriptional regulator